MNKTKLTRHVLAIAIVTSIASTSILAATKVRLRPGNDFTVEKRSDQTQKFAVKIEGGMVFPLYAAHSDFVGPVEVGECYWNTTDELLFCASVAGANGNGATWISLGNPPAPAFPTITAPSGRIWMERNIGAEASCSSATDASCFGSLFQWGRAAEGHQCQSMTDTGCTAIAGQTATQATTPTPSAGNAWDGEFITGPTWLDPASTTWMPDGSGANNVCPAGYHVGTQAEYAAEGVVNAPTGYSILKMPYAGYRDAGGGGRAAAGGGAYYWTSTVTGVINSIALWNGGAVADNRGEGLSVRCAENDI